MKKNDVLPLEITDCTLDGSGVGRADGMAVFVPFTAPGDRLDAHILRVKSNCAFAKIDALTSPSPLRSENDCPVYTRCGGCRFRHLTYEAELEIKRGAVASAMKRIGGVEAPVEEIVPAPSVTAYRNKAQYPVGRDENGKTALGFFAARSHRMTHCENCLLQPPEFERAAKIFAEYADKNGLSVYDEATGKGLLRHLFLRRAHSTGELAVCAVINGRRFPKEEELAAALVAELPQIKSVTVNSNTRDTNVVLGDKTRVIYGDGFITDRLCGMSFRLSAHSFYQVNSEQAEVLYGIASDYAALTGSETLLDLYCGIGTIGLTMAKRAGRLIGAEIVPQAVEDARLNAQINGVGNAEFICGDASDAAAELTKRGIAPDVIILDPPRRGCAPELVETAAKLAPERIVYISCDPATLARDCKRFSDCGYTTVRVKPVDMFPRCGHVETVVLMSRVQD